MSFDYESIASAFFDAIIVSDYDTLSTCLNKFINILASRMEKSGIDISTPPIEI